MARIELVEPRPRREVAAQTFLRVALGCVIAADGARGLLDQSGLQAVLAPLRVPLPESVIWWLLVGQIALGALLVLGMFTKTAAFAVLLGSSGALLVQLWVQHELGAALEAQVLLIASALFQVTLGGGPLSADHARAERLRRKAIQDDPIWNHPPYVAS